MGPGRSRFWFPPPRLGAGVAACAAALCLTLQGFRPEILSAESSREEDGSAERRKRRQEKRRQMIENILRGRWHGATLQEPVAVLLPREVADEIVPTLPIEILPERMKAVDFPGSYALLSEEMRAWSRPPPLLEAVFALPDKAMEVAARTLQLLRPGDGGIFDRLLDVGVENREESLVPDLMQRLVEREQRYFSRFGESKAADTLDVDDFLADQRKVVWEALRRTYISRYRVRADETLRDEAFNLNGWKGVDLLVVPPLLAGYALYHGVDRRFHIYGMRTRVSIEPFSDWRGRDLPAGAGFEWAPGDWPVSFIMTAGLEDGRLKGDFIGIGTSVGMVRRMLALEGTEGVRER